MANYYCHLYLEDNGDDQPDNTTSVGRVIPGGGLPGAASTSRA
jgi:hypothetical protein